MKRTAALATVFLLAVSGLAGQAMAGDGPYYKVSITNLTRGQVFTPVLAVSHGPAARLFQPGSPASSELEMLAEGGDPSHLQALLRTLPAVEDAQTSAGPVPPGHTVTIEVADGPRGRLISLAAMLVPTNDAFVALNGVPAPNGNGAAMFTAYAWDAGTEANDELCESIPGPPGVCEGEGYNPSREGAELYVHIHAGIQNSGDLASADRDWNNPVARVVVTRMPGNGDDEGDDEDDDSSAARALAVRR